MLRTLKNRYSIILLIFLISSTALTVDGQDRGSYEYSREFIWGINKNTNGGLIGGFIMRFGKAIKKNQFQTLGFELMNVKHPKEFKYVSNLTGNSFIWGKSNYLYAIRGQYGREMIIFQKASQQGVQISGGVAAGPSIGIVAPYFIELSGGDNRVSEQFDPDEHGFNEIRGGPRLFEGIAKSEFRLGLNAKASVSFEFGTFKSNVTGFEIGVLAEQYVGETIQLIPTAENDNFFFSAFITLFYGSRR